MKANTPSSSTAYCHDLHDMPEQYYDDRHNGSIQKPHFQFREDQTAND